MDNNNNMEDAVKAKENKSKKTKIIVAIIAGVLIATGVLVLVLNNISSDEDKPVIETEIATDADGIPTVIQGTTPNGTLIENGTYPDGTEVEFATTVSGEYATEADGSYIINYIETATTVQNNDSSSNSNSSSGNNSGSSNSDSSAKTENNSSSVADSSNNSESTSTVSSSSSSSSLSSSSNTSNNSSSSSNISNSSSSNSSSGNITINGDATATINGSSYSVGDKIKVSYYMQSSVKFCGIQCDVNYDSAVLTPDASSINMDNLAGAMCNAEIENQVRFLSSSASAVNDFTTEKLLFSCEFEVLTATTSDITLNVVDILDNDVLSISSDNYSITAKIEKV